VLAALRARLSADELERADRPPFAAVRRRNVVTRAAIRSILSGYLGCGVHELVFDAEPRP
jgi:phosphopantetheinyl transferase